MPKEGADDPEYFDEYSENQRKNINSLLLEFEKVLSEYTEIPITIRELVESAQSEAKQAINFKNDIKKELGTKD